jgi:hypothetical protein
MHLPSPAIHLGALCLAASVHAARPKQAPKRFVQFDSNSDGFLSRGEFVQGGRSRRSP